MVLNVLRRDHFTPSGVVVHQDDGGGGELERALDHLARINRGVVDGAGLMLLIGDQVVAFVEEQNAEMLLARFSGLDKSMISKDWPQDRSQTCCAVLRNFPISFQWFPNFPGDSMQYTCNMRAASEVPAKC